MGKLMKYDLRAALRLFIPVWIGILILSAINAIVIYSSPDWDHWILDVMTTLCMVANVLLLVSMFVITMIYVVLRFYQSMIRDEAYLTFTLPVRVDSILWAKIFGGMILYGGSFLVFLASVCILVSGGLEYADLPYIWRGLTSIVSAGELIATAVFFLILALVGLIMNLLQMFVAMAIGQLSQKHKVLASVGAYIGINIAISTVTSTIVTPIMVFGIANWDRTIFATMRAIHILWVYFAGIFVLSAVLSAVFYFVTRQVFARKLNLE